jgi:cell division protein FtsI/penicillin-binding protein 2
MLSTTQRIWLLNTICLVFFAILIARLIDLQIIRTGYFTAIATSQRQRAAELAPSRGTIYLQERNSSELFPVAVNNKSWLAYAVPRDMTDPLRVADVLAPALLQFRERQQQHITSILSATGQTSSDQAAPDQPSYEDQLATLRDELYRKFNQHTDPYEPFLKFYEYLDDELYNFLSEQQLTGIKIEETTSRVYPEKTLAAHALGYVGWLEDKKVGRYGVEGNFEQSLAGDLGFFSMEHDTTGQFIGVGSRQFEPATDGESIVLTLDRVIQSAIEDELKDGVTRYGAERGSVIVMDPRTGAIIGMATYPTYDPNYYYAISDAKVQLNPIISDIFEPGSVLKPVIMSAAIEEGLVTPQTTFNDNGPVKVAKYTINTFDGQHHGVQTMTQVLEKSNNIGMVWVGQQLGAETMYDFLRRFGLGEKTGVELEGETQNTLKEPDQWNVATVATTSFGQGVALTPLQILNAINVIANDGTLMQPYIVSRRQPSNGEEEITVPTQVRRVISPGTAGDVSAMMVSVIENGVATLARVPGYYLAGKTGTAQVPDDKGAYSPDRKIISFVGFGPIDHPQFSILIKLDNPSGLSFASGTAAPMFKRISEKIINYLQIPPDYDPSKRPPKYEVGKKDQAGA